MSQTIVHYLQEAKNRGNQLASLHKVGGAWKEETWSDYYQCVEKIAGYLKVCGIHRGDRVALISETRYEWGLVDLAVLSLGAITVPIYPSCTESDISYILKNSEAKLLVLENNTQLKKWENLKDQCSDVKKVISIDPCDNLEFLEEVMKSGEQYAADNKGFLEAEVENCKVTEIATILYTSGTTGDPKGVVITHEQVISELVDVFQLLGLKPEDRNLSFLPLSHILGRIEMWGQIVVGFSTAYAESIEKIRANLGEVSPTFLIAVPRIFEKIYNGVLTNAETSPMKSKIFKWAIGVGKQVSKAQLANKTVDPLTALQYKLATKLVFSKLHEKLGGRLKWALSGSAPLSKEISQFFHAAGVLVLEGYGLTETTGGIAANAPHDFDFGSVGKPIGEAQIKIANDGEILVKSKKVMKEYYKNPEATAEAIKDGWFHTGDIGEFTPEGRLKITDRKKDLIKTAGGKYVAPQKLEGLLKLNSLISNALIHGDQRKYVVALITLDPDEATKFAQENGLPTSIEELSTNEKMKEKIREAVAEVNSNLASYESIKTFAILHKDFTIEEGELTPSLKVKRKVCDEKYKDVIDKLYGADSSAL